MVFQLRAVPVAAGLARFVSSVLASSLVAESVRGVHVERAAGQGRLVPAALALGGSDLLANPLVRPASSGSAARKTPCTYLGSGSSGYGLALITLGQFGPGDHDHRRAEPELLGDRPVQLGRQR